MIDGLPDNPQRLMLETHNDLTPAAIRLVPDIENALRALDTEEGCNFSRMTGSGSACFGLFESEALAQKAASKIAEHNPDWWVQYSCLGRSTRY